jgi:hypothetical protein
MRILGLLLRRNINFDNTFLAMKFRSAICRCALGKAAFSRAVDIDINGT